MAAMEWDLLCQFIKCIQDNNLLHLDIDAKITQKSCTINTMQVFIKGMGSTIIEVFN